MSFRCPTCKAKAFCKNTRGRQNGSVNRTYRCVDGHRFSSIEVIVRVGRGKGHLPVGGGSLTGKLSATLLAEAKEVLAAVTQGIRGAHRPMIDTPSTSGPTRG